MGTVTHRALDAHLAAFRDMAQLVIRFRRPESLSDEEMQTWLSQRAHGRQPAVALARVGDEGEQALVLNLDGHASEEDPYADQLIDLLTDMRLLGMKPSSAESGFSPAA